MKYYSIKYFNGKEFFESNLFFSNVNQQVELTFKSEDFNIRTYEYYPFLALVKLRRELELFEIKLMCNGARLDVYPSSGMMIGINAYKLVLGKPVTKENICKIFDPVDDVSIVATVDEQHAYYIKWLESLKGKLE
ncbi:hypothetical protein [Chitinophaga silvisoli]|uniref:Uncharacterized protein n=1 Tax=Chitinophaga silvisoli TaxID=2291814 RepID=A0A3E1NMX4_9BACT|nr:hypothetical protein [Chitinophaga silvisoli]RFM29271.1 hypothetical protein DXN04_33540 [Chitinophaga silvisoli]